MRLSSPFLLICLVAPILWLAPGDCLAQASVRLELNCSSYLQYEQIYARVTIRNFSAHPLAFGESKGLAGSLKFEIQCPDGKFAPLLGNELPPMLGVLLPAGASQTMTFPITAYYKVKERGRYSVKAIVEHSQFTSAYESNQMYFTVTDGTDIWERTVGVPEYIKKSVLDAPVVTRKYKIVSFHDGKNKVYCLKIEDDKSVYAVKRIGFEMGESLRPKCEIDALSRINIMLPVSPKVSVYYQYDLDGKLAFREVYIKTNTTPSIVVDKTDGAVVVAGGRVARKDTDYEEIKDLPFMDQAVDRQPTEEEKMEMGED